MKKERNRVRKIVFFLMFFGLSTFIIFIMNKAGFSKDFKEASKEQIHKVLVLPFEVYADREFQYLKEAIPQMLISRLFVSTNIEVVDLEKVKEKTKGLARINTQQALEIGRLFNANYVILGSVTILGDTVSIDAQVLDLSEKKKPVQFFQEIRGVSEIIPQLTRFALKAKSYIEGSEEAFYKAEPFYGQVGYSISREHPERGYMYYFPYLYPPRPQEERPKVTRARGFYDVEIEDALTKGLVIDVTRGTVGWAEDEQERQKDKKGNFTQGNATMPQYPYYYPPQPYFSYSPPPYYYYQEEEGILSKILGQIPFFKERKRATPQYYQTQVINVPQLPPQPTAHPQPQTSPPLQPQSPPQISPQPQGQTQPQLTPRSYSETNLQRGSDTYKTSVEKGKENPWSWN